MEMQGELLEAEPTKWATWVVFEARIGMTLIWAWCLVVDGPGFDRVEYTDTTGVEAVEVSGSPEMTRYLFKVSVDAPADPFVPARAWERVVTEP
jgi:hypothetical protein